MIPSISSPRCFSHGRVFMTSNVVTRVRRGELNVLQYLERHLTCDWGDASEARKELNDAAVEHRGVIVSRYGVPPALQIVIVTNGDRSLTKVMLLTEFLDDLYD
jgi:hypothetical protein